MNEGTETNARTVAVKMVLSQTNNTRNLEALVTELKVLIHLGSHVNVANHLGACTKKVSRGIQNPLLNSNQLISQFCIQITGELMMMIEYCRYGSLHRYITHNQNNFVNQIANYYNTVTHRPDLLNARNQGVVYRTGDDVIQLAVGQDSAQSFSTSDLICWSFQIARGMDYLASKTVGYSIKYENDI